MEEKLVVTLPNGRHVTNPKRLIKTDKAKRHFQQASEIIKEECF